MKKIIYHTSRILLGLVFTFSGFVKAVDPMGTGIKFADYFKYAFDLPGLTPLSLPLSFLLCGVELLIGLLLIFNLLPRLATWLAVGLLIIFTPLTFYLAVANPVRDCGCFGDAIKLTNWQTFWKNIIFDILLFFIFIWRNKFLPKRPSLKTQKMIAVSLLLFVFGFELYNYSYLPIIDFRPYKEGVNIKEEMQIPPDAPQPEYKTILVYKNKLTGEVKNFTEDNYPWDDSNWVWQDTKSVLVKQGYVPPIHDFKLIDMYDRDITDSILNIQDTVVLVVSYDLEKVSGRTFKKVKNFIDSLKIYRPNIHIFCLTSSEDVRITWVKENYGLDDWTFCKIDEVTAKTIIRANPGIVLLRNGVILKKLHYHSLNKNHLKLILKN